MDPILNVSVNDIQMTSPAARVGSESSVRFAKVSFLNTSNRARSGFGIHLLLSLTASVTHLCGVYPRVIGLLWLKAFLLTKSGVTNTNRPFSSLSVGSWYDRRLWPSGLKSLFARSFISIFWIVRGKHRTNLVPITHLCTFVEWGIDCSIESIWYFTFEIDFSLTNAQRRLTVWYVRCQTTLHTYD